MLDELMTNHAETIRLCEERASLDWDLQPSMRKTWLRSIFRREARPLADVVTLHPAAATEDEPSLPRAA